MKHLLKVHFGKPLTIEDNLGTRVIQNFHRLLLIALRIFHDLLMRKLRRVTERPFPIADHGSEIANDKHGLMSDVLELAQFLQDKRMPEMNVGAGRIDPKFYAQRALELQLFAQLRLADDLRAALFKKLREPRPVAPASPQRAGVLFSSCSATRAPDRSSLACRVG